jgi:hypothetical protein
VLVLAAAGLVLLWRAGRRAEVLVCAAVTAALLVAECGYFDPYGGLSPGPRYLIPALPFLCVGLGPAFARWRWITASAAIASVVAQTALVTTWSAGYDYAGTVWTQIAKALPHHTHSLLYESLTGNVFEWLGASRLEAVGIDCGFVAAACLVTAASLRR